MEEKRTIPFCLTDKISDFEEAIAEDIRAAIREERKTIISSDNVFGYTHGKQWRTRIPEDGDESESGKMRAHTSEVEIPFQEIVDNDLGALARYKASVVNGLMQEFMSTMYETISESTQKSGNIVKSGGGGFRAEQFIEMLEKIEFGVDRNGNVSLPQIHAGPELVRQMLQELSAQGPEFEKRVQEIIQRKAAAALEREDERKSKFPKRDK